METTYTIVDQPAQSAKRCGVFLTYKIIAVVAVIVLVLVISLVLLAAFLGPGRKRSCSEECGDGDVKTNKDKQTSQLTCDVAIVGGGISGLYVAETLLRLQKETNVCLFERDDRFGGRILDHTFQRMPGVPVSLGAWRVDESHSIVLELFKRFNLSVSYLAKRNYDRLEARGVFATDRLTLKKKAFPLLNHGKFENSTYEEMLGYLFSQSKEATKFPGFPTFASEYLTPEGYRLFNHMTGFIPNYARQFSATSLVDAVMATANFKHNYSRPDKGLSSITQQLKFSVTKLGARLYQNEEIKVMEETLDSKFKLITNNYTVTANKLVVAVPPVPLKRIKGSVAEKIQNDSIFKTIQYAVAFKGFAVFENAWWQLNSTGSRYLADEQEMLSTSDCLGHTFPYKPRGARGEAILQMSYAGMSCAIKWGELLKISKETVDREIHRALSRLFPGVDIPKPLDSKYIYWKEGFIHMQGQGTHLPRIKVSDWAKRPFEKQDLFIVGEAYQPLIWIEGALQSAKNALHEGWDIDNSRQKRELTPESSVNNKIDSTLMFP